LGVDVPTATIVDAVRDEAASAVCLSALMTTTLPAMVDTVQALNKAYPDLPVFLGGAVVTLDWAQAQKGLYEPDAPALATAIVKLIKST
jgi:5-methyltetrahydrofolate--homocysteine methyltransferase